MWFLRLSRQDECSRYSFFLFLSKDLCKKSGIFVKEQKTGFAELIEGSLLAEEAVTPLGNWLYLSF